MLQMTAQIGSDWANSAFEGEVTNFVRMPPVWKAKDEQLSSGKSSEVLAVYPDAAALLRGCVLDSSIESPVNMDADELVFYWLLSYLCGIYCVGAADVLSQVGSFIKEKKCAECRYAHDCDEQISIGSAYEITAVSIPHRS